MNKAYSIFQKRVFNCKKCPRLVSFKKKITKDKRKSFSNETYWGKPVTGYGDLNAKIVLIGLAPAAHGATRTGRVFTGDKSSDFLFKCLHKSGLSNQSFSNYRNDNLKLKNTYITLALKCVPPQDKPTSNELKNCSKIFDTELKFLKKKKIIIALGKIAFDACIKFYKDNYKLSGKFTFGHNVQYKIGDIVLLGCYHPSPRNVNTKRIDIPKMVSLFKKAVSLAEKQRIPN
ncbi:MAG: uracil-DNA glycosylase [Pelagibacteraceae bacterium]